MSAIPTRPPPHGSRRAWLVGSEADPAALQGIVLASPKFGHSMLEMKLALQRSVQVAIPPRRPAGLVRRDPCGGIEMVTFGEDPARMKNQK